MAVARLLRQQMARSYRRLMAIMTEIRRRIISHTAAHLRHAATL